MARQRVFTRKLEGGFMLLANVRQERLAGSFAVLFVCFLVASQRFLVAERYTATVVIASIDTWSLWLTCIVLHDRCSMNLILRDGKVGSVAGLRVARAVVHHRDSGCTCNQDRTQTEQRLRTRWYKTDLTAKHFERHRQTSLIYVMFLSSTQQ
jgi:hypothetical protein